MTLLSTIVKHSEAKAALQFSALRWEVEPRASIKSRRRGKAVPPKLMVNVVERGGKYYVSVHTPMGTPDVQHPTTFEPDYQDEIGPFDTEAEAKKKLKQTEDDLRGRGELWIPKKPGAKSKRGAKRKDSKKGQKKLF